MRKPDGCFYIDAAHHAVAADIGVDDRFAAIVFEFLREIDYFVAGQLAPAVGRNLAVFGVQPDNDLARKSAARIMQEAGILDRCGADDDLAQAGIQITLDGIQVADAAA